jgi:hypothetical protein
MSWAEYQGISLTITNHVRADVRPHRQHPPYRPIIDEQITSGPFRTLGMSRPFSVLFCTCDDGTFGVFSGDCSGLP